jgi:F-type H+-transporting ATPase subunit b
MDLLTPSFGLLIWTLLAFVIVFLILRKFAWGPILSALGEREKTIADSLATAERVKTEMALLKSENEALLAKAREERSAMLKEAKETRDRIVNEAKEQAKQEASKILADANAALQNQKMAVLTDVKNQIGNMVIDISEKVIRRSLDNRSEQESYIRQLADDVQLLGRK